MHIFRPLSLLASVLTGVQAQNAPVAPSMKLLYSMVADLGPQIDMGAVPTGQQRIVIPIIGGNFTGPRMSGKILNLGADWLLVDTRGNSRPDTRYNIQTDDGTYIFVQTEGPTLKDGRILLRMKYETAINGTYGWLNDVVAVGVLNVNGDRQVLIDAWEVSPQ